MTGGLRGRVGGVSGFDCVKSVQVGEGDDIHEFVVFIPARCLRGSRTSTFGQLPNYFHDEH